MSSLAGIALVNVPAAADECWPECEKVYRAIALGPIKTPTALGLPFTGDFTFGINRHGDVVWFVDDQVFGGGVPIRSYVRVTKNKFGLMAGVTYELLPPASLADRTVVIATDINDDGWIVGYVGNVQDVDLDFSAISRDTDARAVIWRLDQASGTPPVIPAFNAHPASVLDGSNGSVVAGCASVLHAVNNDDPPMVAGRVRWNFCQAPCVLGNEEAPIGFTRCGSLTTTAFAHRGSHAGWAVALDISTSDPLVSPFPLTVGYDGSDGTGCPWPDIGQTQCKNVNWPADGLAWPFGSTVPLVLFELGYPLDRGRTQGRGVVTGGEIVGGSELPIGPGFLCRMRSTFWASAASHGVSLWDVCGGGDEANQAEAIVEAAGIDPSSSHAVVGGTTENNGLIWLDRSAGGWCCNRLEPITVNAISAGPNTTFIVRYGHDLAPTGQIVADVAVRQLVDGIEHVFPHAALLTCVFDLDGDLRVNGADLGILLQNWNTWNDVLDLTCDGFINGADLGALLNAWTSDDLCRIGQDVIKCGCEQAAQATEGVSLTFEQAVLMAGFNSVEAFVEWGVAAPAQDLDSAGLFIAVIMQAIHPPAE